MIPSSILGFAFALATSISPAHPKDGKYPVSTIPEALKKNANAVVREDEMTFTIQSQSSSLLHVHHVTTIMNANAKEKAVVVVGYDKLRKLKDIKASVYDATGELIKKAKASDYIDRSYSEQGTIFDDSRYKAVDLSQGTYPYTIEYEYEVEYNHLFQIPGSTVLAEENVSVEHFRYQLNYPIDLKPRYKANNFDQKPAVVASGSSKESMTWEVSNVPTLAIEPTSPISKYTMSITAAPGDFEIAGYAGNMSSWKDIGKWQFELNKGRDVLPEDAKRKVAELTKGLTTTEAKVKAVYEYMQSRTRYVGIQLGIGGWQPFDATTVDQTGYGDCKALSNYTVALLKEIGIPAYYTLIKAGTGENVDRTFPGRFFNHVIVSVPNKTDTLWLECTSQTKAFGYMGKFTDNRNALMITENGGVMTKTPYYGTDVNIQNTSAEVVIDASGNAKAKVKTDYSGLQYENNNLDFYINYSSDEQKKWIQKNTNIPAFNVDKFSIANKKAKIPTATVEMDLTMNRLASLTNKRLFLTPNLLNRWSFIPEKVTNRKNPVVLRTGYTDNDTIRYTIPESMYPEFLPPNTTLNSRFGSYESGFKLDQGSVIYFRRMKIKDGEYPAEAYQELIDFYRSINKADNTKLVFLSKT